MALRLAVLGSSPFTVPSLRACLAAGHDVVLVVTQPQRPGDRGRPAPRPVADAASDLGLPVACPERLRDPAAIAEVLHARPDALVVAAYGQILPAELLDAVRLGGVNVHASLLPRWRGAAPVAAAILAGDPETGVSIMRMDAGLDTGPVYATRRVRIGPRETTPELTARLAEVGASLLVEVLAALERGEAVATPQDDSQATYAPRLRREQARIDWAEWDAAGVDRHLRAFTPWPGTTVVLAGEEVKLVAGEPLEETSEAPPGTIVRVVDGSVDVATRQGLFRVHAVHPPGRRPMEAAAYLRGRRIVVPRRVDERSPRPGAASGATSTPAGETR